MRCWAAFARSFVRSFVEGVFKGCQGRARMFGSQFRWVPVSYPRPFSSCASPALASGHRTALAPLGTLDYAS